MKPLLFSLLVALVGSALVRSQDVPVVETRESGTAPPAIPTAAARIIGNIPDGTPPLPQPPKPKDIVLNFWRTEKPAPVKGANK